MSFGYVLRRFAKAEEGAAAIEFAVVATMFFTLMMGAIEFGMYMMTQVAIESAVTQAGRLASVGVTNGMPDRVTAVRTLINQKMVGVRNPILATIDAAPVEGSTGGTAASDYCLFGANSLPVATPTCPPGNQFIDNNGNGVYDYVNTSAMSVGEPGQLIEVRVTYPWQVIFPILGKFFGNNGVVLITSSTVVKNEMFPTD